MRRPDWTPAVLITASISLTVVVAVFLTSPLFLASFQEASGPGRARHGLSPEVDVWVGKLGPGVVGVLAPVWGEAGPDQAHDRELDAELSLASGETLAWYQLLLFNTGDADRQVSLGEGAITIAGTKGATVASQSLPALLAKGEARVAPGVRAVLRAHGALDEAVTVPAGTMADLLVPFARRVDLHEAAQVASATGGTFHRRRMARSAWEGLVTEPRREQLEDL